MCRVCLCVLFPSVSRASLSKLNGDIAEKLDSAQTEVDTLRSQLEQAGAATATTATGGVGASPQLSDLKRHNEELV